MNIIIRHNKDQLKESLSTEDIKQLLTSLGAEDFIDEIDTKEQMITNTVCHSTSGGKMKLYYYPHEKGGSFHCYSNKCSCNYDIFSLTMKVFENRNQELSFPSAVDYVARTTGKSFGFGFGFELEKEEKKNPEMEWMNRVTRKKKVELPELKFYNEAILEVFSHHNNPSLFRNDHISEAALDKFGVKYYDKASRIVLVNRFWENGKIIGLRGRYNGVLESGMAKYIPVTIQGHTYSYPTFMNLYGLHENRVNIEKMKKAILFESEKSVLQCESYWSDSNFSVALSGSSLSQYQVNVLLGLGINEIIIAMDCEFQEGDRDAEMRQMQKVLQMARRFTPFIRTTVLWNTDRLIGFKQSPSDRGRDVLIKMLENKQEVLNIADEVNYKSNV